MNDFFTGSMTGIHFGSVLLSVLELTTVMLFLIGSLGYWKLTKKIGSRQSQRLALTASISCLIGGFPNALDKISQALFSYDLWFNSTWMFFFVGIGYILLFLSVLRLDKKDKQATTLLAAAAVPGFHKPMKYCGMLAAAVGMLGFYIGMFRRSRKVIGAKAGFYLVTLCTTAFLVVFAAAGHFDTVWPNVLAQTVNSLGYAAFIAANLAYRKAN